MFGNNDYIASRKVCKDLEDLMNDDDVKAVVVGSFPRETFISWIF